MAWDSRTAWAPAAALCVGLWAASAPALAQNIISSDKYFDERLRGARQIIGLGDDVFGDSVSLKDGDFAFSQDDVSVPTNSGLRLAFGRQTPQYPQGLDKALMPLGATWEIKAPYMAARYDTRYGWTSLGSQARCSSPDFTPQGTRGPEPDYNTMGMPAWYYWTGIHINIPGAGYEPLLKIGAQNPRPNDGVKYVGSTRSDWRISCLGALKKGAGEGFLVHLPDGQKVFFDWMATRDAPDVLANPHYQDEKGNGTAPPYLLVPTTDVFLYATRVEDRFGNFVTYQYDANNPHRLTRIQSSDGAHIDIDYGTNGRVSTVRTGGRSWAYRYRTTPHGESLSEVQLPDGSRWKFGGDVMSWKMRDWPLPGEFYGNYCHQDAVGYRSSDPDKAGYTHTIVIEHPSGAIAEFKARGLIHGSDNTPGGCDYFGNIATIYFGSYGIPNAYLAHSLVSKKISGAGGVNRVWTYAYSPGWSFKKDCSAGCTSTTVVSEPSGATRTYRFGNSYTDNLGDLLSETLVEGGKTKQTTRHVRKVSTGDFPDTYGAKLAVELANPLQLKVRPVQTVEQIVDGVKFTRTVEKFDVFARPTRVTRASAPSP